MRYLFIDRDGTLIEEPPDTQQVDSCERLRPLPYVISTLRLAQRLGYRLVLITNQDGLGTPNFPEEAFWGPHRLLMRFLASEGITWYGQHIDRSPAGAPSPYRKPSPLLLLPYLTADLDREASFVIGDRPSDVELARRLGLKAIWLENSLHPLPEKLTPYAHKVANWLEIGRFLSQAVFFTREVRQTRETAVQLALSLYGQGSGEIETGIPFFDHMLTLLAFHSGWDMRLLAKGDLAVDLHHTIEDVAIVLGQALARLLWDKKGLRRYGQALLEIRRHVPMDEALGVVAVDLSGRGVCRWQVPLGSAMPGGVPPSLWKHFFETLAREGRFNLHLWAQGEDEHHLLESLFKGLGRALREALSRDWEALSLPSTKGVL